MIIDNNDVEDRPKQSQTSPGRFVSLSCIFHMIKIEFGETIVKMIYILS